MEKYTVENLKKRHDIKISYEGTFTEIEGFCPFDKTEAFFARVLTDIDKFFKERVSAYAGDIFLKYRVLVEIIIDQDMKYRIGSPGYGDIAFLNEEFYFVDESLYLFLEKLIPGYLAEKYSNRESSTKMPFYPQGPPTKKIDIGDLLRSIKD